MDNDHPDSRLRAVGTVFVPVRDQERALAFYRDKLGFALRGDFPYGGGLRWVEVAPPGSANALALVPAGEGEVRIDERTLCAFAVQDAAAAHARLRAQGVRVDAQVGRQGSARPGLMSTAVTVPDPFPPQFSFYDEDGNRFLAVQQPS